MNVKLAAAALLVVALGGCASTAAAPSQPARQTASLPSSPPKRIGMRGYLDSKIISVRVIDGGQSIRCADGSASGVTPRWKARLLSRMRRVADLEIVRVEQGYTDLLLTMTFDQIPPELSVRLYPVDSLLDVKPIEVKKYGVSPTDGIRYTLEIAMGADHDIDMGIVAEVIIGNDTFDARIIRVEGTTSIVAVDLPASVDTATAIVRLLRTPSM